MSLLVTNIQRFSVDDGPGIRTTVFLKGCNLRCPWCCNPENINPYIEGIYGKEFEINNLFEILLKDKEFYKASGGGITFSGGEPLLQAKELQFILKKLKKEEINVAIETSLFCPPEFIYLVKDYINLFIVDIKILDSQKCQEYLGGDIRVYYKNLEILLKSREKNFIFRFPMIKPLTFNQENLRNLYDFIRKWQIKYLEIFNVHNLAEEKYKSLGKIPPQFKKVSNEEIDSLMKEMFKMGVKIKLLTF